MTKDTVLTYLNSRLNKPYNNFNLEDVSFIQAFIQDRTGTLVDKEKIANSIQAYPESCMRWFDFMLTFLVNHYDLKVETADPQKDKIEFFQSATINSFMGIQGEKIIKYTA